MTPEEHVRVVETWRRERLARLRSPEGWLALVGLEWLRAGESRIGSGADCEIRLPAGPLLAGWIEVEGAVTLRAAPGVHLTHAGRPIDRLRLTDDTDESPTVVELGSLRFHLIRRGARLGVRIRDMEAPALRTFTGLDHYPIDLAWRLSARCEAPSTPVIAVPDVLGQVTEEPLAATVLFTLHGRECRLDALPGGDDGSLWLVFADPTNASETYPAGRFVYSGPPIDGHVTVDFNLAYNPPCAFTPFATCPLPPVQNRLPVPVRAGERRLPGEGLAAPVHRYRWRPWG